MYLMRYFYLFIACAESLLLHGLSLAVAIGATLYLGCMGFSLWSLLLLQRMGSRAHKLQ